jgi:hypothetical protein
LTTAHLVSTCARLRQRTAWDVETTATVASLRTLARRMQLLNAEIAQHTRAAVPPMPPSLSAELLAVVDRTMQPTQASLWLRQGPSNGLAAAVGPGTHHQEQAT